MKSLNHKTICQALLIIAISLFLATLYNLAYSQDVKYTKDVIEWYVGWENNPDSLKVYIGSSFTEEEQDSVRAAMKRWNDAGCEPKLKETNESSDAQIPIEKGTLDPEDKGICEITKNNSDNKVTKAEITISNIHNSPPNPLSLKEVVTHELGHALGLKDTDETANSGDVMKGSGPTNGTDGRLSRHDSTELAQAAGSITVMGTEPPQKVYCIYPQEAIMPGTFSELGFELPYPFPPETVVAVQSVEDDQLFVEFVNLIGNILEVGVVSTLDHWSGEMYLNISAITPIGEEFLFIGAHFIHQNPVPPISFDCPFMIEPFEDKFKVNWQEMVTYPFTNPLRATLVVNEKTFYEMKPTGNFLVSLFPGENLIQLFVDDHQVNHASSSQVYFVSEMMMIQSLSTYKPYPGENVRIRGDSFGEYTPECGIEINGLLYYDVITYWSNNAVFFDMPESPAGDAFLRIFRSPGNVSNPVMIAIVKPAEAFFLTPNENEVVSSNIAHLSAAAEIYQELIFSASFYYRPTEQSGWNLIGTDYDGINKHYSTTQPIGTGNGWAISWNITEIEEMEVELKTEMVDVFGNILTGFRSIVIDKTPLAPHINFDQSKLFGGKALTDDTITFDIEVLEIETSKVEFRWAPPPIPIGWFDYERELEPVGQNSITFVDENGNDISETACGPSAMASCLKWLSQKYPNSNLANKPTDQLAQELAGDAHTDSTGTRDDNLAAAAEDQLENDPGITDDFEVERHHNNEGSATESEHNVYNDIAAGLRDSSDVVLLIYQINGEGDTLGHYVTASSHHTTISYYHTDEFCAAIQTSYIDFMDPATGETVYKIINWYDNPPQIQDYDLDTTKTGNAWVERVITIKPKHNNKNHGKDLNIAEMPVNGAGSYQFSIPTAQLADGVNIIDVVGIDLMGNESTNRVTCVVGVYQPIANFTAETTNGYPGISFKFNDNSNPADSIVSWQWHFGDGMESDEQHPEHAYSDPGVYNVTLVVSDGNLTDTLVRENYITVTPFDQHNIQIYEGWSGISTFIDPSDPDIETMFSPVIDELTILYNMSGVYWPGENINSLYYWNVYKGYVAKFTDDITLSFEGQDVSDNPLPVSQGWNIIPVFTMVSAADALGNLPGFIVAKGVASNEILWPAYNINTMPMLITGMSYYVYTTLDGTINFTKGSATNPNDLPEMISTNPWNDLIPTPNTHLVAFTTQSLKSLQAGDLLAAFMQSGRCAGASLVTDPEKSMAVILFGDDPTTREGTGFSENEPIMLKVYRQSTGEEIELEATWDKNLNHSGAFETNGLSAVIDLKMSGTSISQPSEQHLSIYPNPSKGIFTVSGMTDDCEIAIFNAQGKEFFTMSFILPAKIDLSTQPKGIYFISIKTDKNIFVKKVILN